MNFYVIPNFSRSNTLDVLGELTRYLYGKGCGVLLSQEKWSHLPSEIEPMTMAGDCSEADFILCIGGDGTIIDGAHESAAYGIPVLGVNSGHLGFLAQVEPERALSALDRVLREDYAVEERFGLSLRILYENREALEYPFALNDIVLTKPTDTNIIDLHLLCDGKEMNHYMADGLIFSTPTGSTAYSLSAGGPIIDPLIKTISIVPICPHSISVRPTVISASHCLAIESRREMVVILDGRTRVTVPAGTVIQVERSKRISTFITFGELEFFEILSKKMMQRG